MAGVVTAINGKDYRWEDSKSNRPNFWERSLCVGTEHSESLFAIYSNDLGLPSLPMVPKTVGRIGLIDDADIETLTIGLFSLPKSLVGF
jgi:hypothetical protein